MLGIAIIILNSIRLEVLYHCMYMPLGLGPLHECARAIIINYSNSRGL